MSVAILTLTLYVFSFAVAVISGIAAAISDFRGMKIPNIYPVLIILSFLTGIITVRLGGYDVIFVSLFSHLISGIIVFGFTYMLFALGAFGAGDSKLMTAYGFWVGLQGLPVFIFYVTIVGAVLAFLALAIMRFPVFAKMPEGSWIARVRARERVVPYGIAISSGAFVAFYFLEYFNIFLFLS
jgi:Flp pilus assembly protein protease CpaA